MHAAGGEFSWLAIETFLTVLHVQVCAPQVPSANYLLN